MNSNGICSRKNFISLDLFCVNYTNIWLMSMLLTCFKLKITEQCFQLVQNVVLVFALPKLLCNFSAEVSIQCNVESRHRIHCMKSVFGVFSGPYFPAFGLNMEIFSVNLRIQSKCGKIWTRKTQNTDTFYTVIGLKNFV